MLVVIGALGMISCKIILFLAKLGADTYIEKMKQTVILRIEQILKMTQQKEETVTARWALTKVRAHLRPTLQIVMTPSITIIIIITGCKRALAHLQG